MGEYEIPLVVFTVFSQWAVGITIAIALIEWLKPGFMQSIGKKTLKTPIYLALGISVIAALSSMLHLNNPFKSYTSLLGTGHSWLSREIITVIIFNLCLVVLAYVWWSNAERANYRKTMVTITAFMGIALIISSATVYFSIQLHPAWNNWTTFANFLLSGFLLGAVTVAYFAMKGTKEETDTSVSKILGIYLSVIIVALVVTLAGSAMISNGTAESQIATAISFTSILFWIRILGSLLIPAALVVYMIASKKTISTNYVLLGIVFVLAGELSGRMIFYYSVMSQYPWF